MKYTRTVNKNCNVRVHDTIYVGHFASLYGCEAVLSIPAGGVQTGQIFQADVVLQGEYAVSFEGPVCWKSRAGEKYVYGVQLDENVNAILHAATTSESNAGPLIALCGPAFAKPTKVAKLFAAMGRCDVAECVSAHEFERLLMGHTPSVVVVPYVENSTDFRTWLKLINTSVQVPKVIMLVEPGARPSASQLNGLRPDAWVTVDHRAAPRLAEQVFQALSLRWRRHVRSEPPGMTGLLRLTDRGTVSYKLADVSESGAGVITRYPLSIGVPVLMEIQLDRRLFRLEAVPIRSEPVGAEENRVGMYFEAPSPEFVQAVRKLVKQRRSRSLVDDLLGAPTRSAPRVAIPRKVRVKVRIQRHEGTHIDYGTVRDASETGFSALFHPRVSEDRLQPNELMNFIIEYSGRSIQGHASVVRSRRQPDGSLLAGFRFEGLERTQARRVTTLIMDLTKRGQAIKDSVVPRARSKSATPSLSPA